MNSVGNRDYWPEEWPDWPEDSRARKAVQSSYDLGLFILNAPASLRKFRLEQAEERAQHLLAQLGDREQERAKSLVALWERNALIQQDIRYEEKKKGMDAVDHLLTKWHSAEGQMRRAKEEASQLGLAGYEYFRSCEDRFYILQEEKDEFGRFHNYPDYSKLRGQWYAREPIMEPLPWPWENMLSLCKRFEARGNKAREGPTGLKFTIAAIVLTIVFGVAGIVATVMMDGF